MEHIINIKGSTPSTPSSDSNNLIMEGNSEIVDSTNLSKVNPSQPSETPTASSGKHLLIFS
jgi:hypothetical protein